MQTISRADSREEPLSPRSKTRLALERILEDMKKPLSPRSAKAKQERQRAEHLAFVEALEKENAQRRAANEEQRTFILAFDS